MFEVVDMPNILIKSLYKIYKYQTSDCIPQICTIIMCQLKPKPNKNGLALKVFQNNLIQCGPIKRVLEDELANITKRNVDYTN
jgi:hypothetical protein